MGKRKSTSEADQKLMRREMEQAKEPESLSKTLDDVFGGYTSPSVLSEYGEWRMQVPTVALEIIDASPNLALSFGQWSIVNAMVEAALIRGYDAGREALRG